MSDITFLTIQTFLTAALSKIIYCVIILIISGILVSFLNKLLRSLLSSKTSRLDERKKNTVLSVLSSVIKVAVYFIAACSILTQFGVSVASVLAVAGVGSVAIAFGAQSLVKDIITGCFILLEDQFGIGDVVTIAGESGVVEDISLRTTSIRNSDGTLFIIPNGSITTVANRCKSYINALVDVGIDYNEDMDRVLEILNDEMDKVEGKIPGLKKRPVVLGITALADSSVNVRIVAECSIKENYAVERALRLAIKKRLDAEGVSIPFPQRTVHIVKAE